MNILIVSAWNLDLECTMSYSRVHEDRLISIESHPSMCAFVTCSNNANLTNSKVQIWSCNFRRPLESFVNFGRLNGLAVSEDAALLIVLGIKLFFLTTKQCYYFFAPLTWVYMYIRIFLSRLCCYYSLRMNIQILKIRS